MELFLERGIQRMKEELRYRLTQKPETLYAGSVLLDHCLARLQRSNPGQLKDFYGTCPWYRDKPLSGAAYDQPDADSGTQLQHRGRPLRRGERDKMVQIVDAFLTRQQPRTPGFEGVGGSACRVHVHTQVCKTGDEMITSREHHRSRSRVSYYVLMQMSAAQQRIARIEYFLRVQPPISSSQPDTALRLAVCTVFAPRAQQGPLLVANPTRIQYEERAFDVDNIATLLVSAHPGRNSSTLNNDADDRGKIFFMRYGNLSKM